MSKRPNPKVKKDLFDAIRKDAMLGVSRDRLARRYRISKDTLRRVVRASGWKEWTAKLEQKRLRYHERKMQAAAESSPDKTGDSGLFSGTMGARAMEETAVDEVIQNPDAPVIVDELHEYQPKPLERLKCLGLPKQICERIHALSQYPDAVEIIGKAVVLCPESIGSLVNTLYFPLFGVKEID